MDDMALAASIMEPDRAWVVARMALTRRKGLGLTQRDLVARLRPTGLVDSDTLVSNLEHGHGWTPSRLVAVADALQCSVTYLLGLTDSPRKWTPDQRRPASVEGSDTPGWLNRQMVLGDLDERFGDDDVTPAVQTPGGAQIIPLRRPAL